MVVINSDVLLSFDLMAGKTLSRRAEMVMFLDGVILKAFMPFTSETLRNR